MARVELAFVVIWLIAYNVVNLSQLAQDVHTLVAPSVISLPSPVSVPSHQQKPGEAPPPANV